MGLLSSALPRRVTVTGVQYRGVGAGHSTGSAGGGGGDTMVKGGGEGQVMCSEGGYDMRGLDGCGEVISENHEKVQHFLAVTKP